MSVLKIKAEHAKTYVAFGKNSKPLGERSQQELNQLAQLAYADESIENLFEGELPSMSDLQKSQLEFQKKSVGLPVDNETVVVKK